MNFPTRMEIRDQYPPSSHNSCIMFTEVAGYTRLVDKDQEATMKLLACNRHLHKFFVNKYGGQLIKEMGDSMLLRFNSAQNAVDCAGDLQKGLKSMYDLQLSIGIHKGEVIFFNDDVFGNVVNIASRIQNYAHQGQILVSEAVANEVVRSDSMKMRCLGCKKFKNIRQKIKTYLIKHNGIKPQTHHFIEGRIIAAISILFGLPGI